MACRTQGADEHIESDPRVYRRKPDEMTLSNNICLSVPMVLLVRMIY
jgi:hypothetical protein